MRRKLNAKRSTLNANSFTLMELLIVIVIIGVLGALIMPAISQARAKARDTRRVKDLENFQTALKLYYMDQQHYPIWEAGGSFAEATSTNPLYQALVPNYLPVLPEDPLINNYVYYYKSDSAGSLYKGVVYLETEGAKQEYAAKDGGTAFKYYEVFTYKGEEQIDLDGTPGNDDSNWLDQQMPGTLHYTKLLLHCNGSNGSTSFLDSSFYNRDITVYNNVQISTEKSKFGGASGFFPCYTNPTFIRSYLQVSNSSDFNFGSNDFTIGFWIWRAWYWYTGSSNNFFYRADGTSEINFYFEQPSGSGGANYINFYSKVNSNYELRFRTSSNLATGNWSHVALVRNGNNWDIYINGQAQGKELLDGSYSSSIANNNGNLQIGDSYWQDIYLDEYRISNGIARWTANFDPPTQEYGP